MNKFCKLLVVLFFSFFFLFENVSAKELTIYFFHGDGCPHCAAEEKELEKILNEYEDVSVSSYEVWYDEENASLMKDVSLALNVKRTGVPLTVIGDSTIIGFGDGTASKIRRAIDYYNENEYEDVVMQVKNGTYKKNEDTNNGSIQANEKDTNKEELDQEKSNKKSFNDLENESDEATSVEVPFWGKVNLKDLSLGTSAVIIGLIDGFNPCAMWILLFLISILIGMKDRKKMWAIGSSFLLTSAAVYFLIIFAWFNIVVKITTIVFIRNIIAIIALIGGIINLYNYFKSQDSGCNVVSDDKRKKIFSRIREFTGRKSLVLAIIGAMGLAISVNLIELACSLGLPLVFTQLLSINKVSTFMSILYTLLYVFFFLLDDFIVFGIAMITTKVTAISTKYNKYSHLIGGIIMLLIGLLLIFKPEWLMFI